LHVLPAPAQTGAGERVLLIDDEADLLRVTRQWLQSLGYAVTAETDARRAVQLLESTPFDALVSDVVMPGGVNGVALADIATQRWPQIAVVLVSGFADVQLGHDIEKYHLLDKPFEKSQLQQALRAAIAQSRNGEKTVPPQQAAA
jgi:CheY-like chemotaxis protein